MTAIDITSEAFGQGARIPDEYTCKGANISPPLSFGSLPEGTQSMVVICDDPDAPSGLVHPLDTLQYPKRGENDQEKGSRKNRC